MKFPIFEAIVKHIEIELGKRSILIDSLIPWERPDINAKGIELIVHLENYSDTLKNMTINLDWDKFREVKLARTLEGMEKHPFIKESLINYENIRTVMDVEVIWNLNPEVILGINNPVTATSRLNLASEWMENINKRFNFLLKKENVMTRWHVEFEGDFKGRYVSNMSLITYYQLSFSEANTIFDVNRTVLTRLKSIQNTSRRLLILTKECLPDAA